MKSVNCGPKHRIKTAQGRSDDGKLRQVFYKSPRWAELRARHLKSQPYCEECLAQYGEWNRKDVIVDHHRGHTDPGWLARFWDPAELRTLCKKHHNKKTARERPDSGFNRPVPSRMTATQRLAIRRRLRGNPTN